MTEKENTPKGIKDVKEFKKILEEAGLPDVPIVEVPELTREEFSEAIRRMVRKKELGDRDEKQK